MTTFTPDEITTETAADSGLMHLDDFIEAYGESPFEWINGERQPVPPQITRSGRTGFRFARLLADHVDANTLGEVFTEVPFVITLDESGWVRGSRTPDVMFYSSEQMTKIQEDENWELKPLIGAPTFAAEIVSPTDRYTVINQKVQGYRRDGVALIWVIDPGAQTVTVHKASDTQQTQVTDPDDTLTTGDVIPGFSLSLKQLFGLS